jgi:probable HAF family extracellular repeat protein
MKSSKLILVGSITLLTLPAIVANVAAQNEAAQGNIGKHHHYKLIDLGTLGGPNSFVTFLGTNTITPRGGVIGEADTPTPDPYAPFCLQSDCLVNHTLLWEDGVSADLGALPGVNSSIPSWINSLNWVVGASENGSVDPMTGFPETAAVLWKNGRIINLGTLGGNVSEANGINDRGQVVGGALNAILDPFSATFAKSFIPFTPGFFFFPVSTQAHAFLWQNGMMQDLGTLGGPDSIAWYVNEGGQVAGQSSINYVANSTTGVPTVDTFFWQNGKMVDIGNLGGDFSWPSGLNNRGDVVGAMFLAGDSEYHPFLWRHGTLKDLGTFGGNAGVANAINGGGEVTGWASVQNGAVFAFLWKQAGMTNLGAVGGDSCSVANGINANDLVVGESSPQCSFAFPDDRAVLWERGVGIDLNTLIPPGSGLNLAVAFSINDHGEINGNGVLSNGDQHAFLLIPCDEDHPGLEGCDYSMLDAATLAQNTESRKSETVPSANVHSLVQQRQRMGRFGTRPTIPQ